MTYKADAGDCSTRAGSWVRVTNPEPPLFRISPNLRRFFLTATRIPRAPTRRVSAKLSESRLIRAYRSSSRPVRADHG
jgi:hypothetical protein